MGSVRDPGETAWKKICEPTAQPGDDKACGEAPVVQVGPAQLAPSPS